MNPITIILILSIVLGVSLILNIVAAVLLNKGRKEINECSQELANQDNQIVDLKNLMEVKVRRIIELTDTISEKENKFNLTLKQYDFKFNEQIRLNNESEQSLKDIISGHDKEMREQREKFEKLLETYYSKEDVINFVRETYKNVKGNNSGVVEYVKEFKRNL